MPTTEFRAGSRHSATRVLTHSHVVINRATSTRTRRTSPSLWGLSSFCCSFFLSSLLNPRLLLPPLRHAAAKLVRTTHESFDRRRIHMVHHRAGGSGVEREGKRERERERRERTEGVATRPAVSAPALCTSQPPFPPFDIRGRCGGHREDEGGGPPVSFQHSLRPLLPPPSTSGPLSIPSSLPTTFYFPETNCQANSDGEEEWNVQGRWDTLVQ